MRKNIVKKEMLYFNKKSENVIYSSILKKNLGRT